MSTLKTDELRALAEAVKEWNSTDVWPHEDCQYTAVIGDIDEDGVQYPIAEINADTYGHDGESLALANFYAAANPAVVLGMLDRIAELEAQLYAIGAGGVEPLRKRECLHQIQEPVAWLDAEMSQAYTAEELADASGTGFVPLYAAPQPARQPLTNAPIDADAQRDAERYRWLRKQHWNEGVLCVVMQPKKAVKLGCDCPSLDRLDCFIDAARAAQGGV